VPLFELAAVSIFWKKFIAELLNAWLPSVFRQQGIARLEYSTPADN
jgi:hypothetical protein